MRVSLNELESTGRKAAIGCGVPVGLAQDAARALAWLGEAGSPALPVLLDALSAYRTPDTSILVLGPSAIDRFLVDGLDQRFGPCDGALLMLGLVACANPRPERIAVTLSDADGCRAVMRVTGDQVTLSEGDVSGPCEIALSAPPAPERSQRVVRAVCPGGVEVAEADWRALEAYAARTLVPADARSREKGAGAGLVDRD